MSWRFLGLALLLAGCSGDHDDPGQCPGDGVLGLDGVYRSTSGETVTVDGTSLVRRSTSGDEARLRIGEVRRGSPGQVRCLGARPAGFGLRTVSVEGGSTPSRATVLVEAAESVTFGQDVTVTFDEPVHTGTVALDGSKTELRIGIDEGVPIDVRVTASWRLRPTGAGEVAETVDFDVRHGATNTFVVDQACL